MKLENIFFLIGSGIRDGYCGGFSFLDFFSVGVVNSLLIIIIVVGVFIFFVVGLGIYGVCC